MGAGTWVPGCRESLLLLLKKKEGTLLQRAGGPRLRGELGAGHEGRADRYLDMKEEKHRVHAPASRAMSPPMRLHIHSPTLSPPATSPCVRTPAHDVSLGILGMVPVV